MKCIWKSLDKICCVWSGVQKICISLHWDTITSRCHNVMQIKELSKNADAFILIEEWSSVRIFLFLFPKAAEVASEQMHFLMDRLILLPQQILHEYISSLLRSS